MRILITGLGLMGALAWPVTQAQEQESILRCFHNGAVIAEAPIPAPSDFRVQMTASAVTTAQWTIGTGQKVVLVSSAPCVYFVTQPNPDEVGAGGG